MQHGQWQALIAQFAELSRHQRLEGMKLLGSTPPGLALDTRRQAHPVG